MLSYIKLLQSIIHKYSFNYHTLLYAICYKHSVTFEVLKHCSGLGGVGKWVVGPEVESVSRNETYGEPSNNTIKQLF